MIFSRASFLGARTRFYGVTAISLVVFLGVVVINAWVVDDAYITFRTVDNFVHGHGLTWNVAERVQAYTHPLWMFLLSAAYFFTHEAFFTSIVLSATICAFTFVVASARTGRGTDEAPWKPVLLALSLLASKAVMDFTTSGMENALSFLIAAVFFYRFLREQPDETEVPSMFFLASLAFVNRQDTLIIYTPALVCLIRYSISGKGKRSLLKVLVFSFPAIAWLIFSILYYGFPFPNPAYAKVLGNAYPLSWKIQRGVDYLLNSVTWDAASWAVLAGAVVLTLRRISWRATAALLGILLYIGFVVVVGASTTHMSGRFFALPLFLGIFLFVRHVRSLRTGSIAALLLIGYLLWSPISSVKFGTSFYHPCPQNESFIDAKWYVLNEGAALLNWSPGRSMPGHVWYRYGELLRDKKVRFHFGGAFNGEAIGYAGYAAGPEVYILDYVGLTDPLLARMPATRPDSLGGWKSGHFRRQIPKGYRKSLQFNANLVQDPELHEYYDKIRDVTRGPLFSAKRLATIVRFNLGRYDALIQ